jgi:tight adherence protein B
MLASLTTAMSAGKTIENSIESTILDLQMVYGQENDEFSNELRHLHAQLLNGVSVEVAFYQFSSKFELDEIKQFSELITSVKRRSGDLLDIIRRVSQITNDRLEFEEELAVLIAQKKLEIRLLFMIPFIFLALLKWTSYDYIKPLYQSIIGNVIMFIALIFLFIAYVIARNLMKIKI